MNSCKFLTRIMSQKPNDNSSQNEETKEMITKDSIDKNLTYWKTLAKEIQEALKQALEQNEELSHVNELLKEENKHLSQLAEEGRKHKAMVEKITGRIRRSF